MIELYQIFTWGLFWLMLFGAILFVTIKVPEKESLQNYKRVRYLLSAVYLLMAVANFMQIMGGNDDAVWYSRIITLWIGCSMASTLTIVNVILINSSFFSFKRFYIELVLPFIFVVLTFVSYLVLSEKSLFFIILYHFFVIYYVFIMGRYTYILMKEYRKFEIRFDNYYTESESNHLKWILKSQVIAIGCGILAFISLFLPLWFNCLFSIFLLIFYTYYAIRFINYPLRFSFIEAVVEEFQTEFSANVNTISFDQLENAVNNWEKRKTFVCSDINIEFVAKELYTNRTYLSNYINTYKKKSFKEWISDLRITEAQRLLLLEPQTSVSEIGYRVGFSDKSNFTNRFSRNTGESPKKWRETRLNKPCY